MILYSDMFGMVPGNILTMICVGSYLSLLSFDRKEALNWWRILLTVLPLLYVKAIISDMIRFGVTFRDLFNPHAPVLFKL